MVGVGEVVLVKRLQLLAHARACFAFVLLHITSASVSAAQTAAATAPSDLQTESRRWGVEIDVLWPIL